VSHLSQKAGWLFRSAQGTIGVVFVGLIVLVAVFAHLLAPYSPDQIDLNALLAAPGAGHWFGTDETGRDILSRVLIGTDYTLPTAVAVVAFSLVGGSLIGVLAGYLGGVTANVIMRVTDLFLSYPSLLLAIAVAAALGQGLLQAGIALAVVTWAAYARLAYVQTVSVRHRLYMDAAEVAGTSLRRKLLRHILPNAAAPLLIKASMDVALCVEWIASLGFIGLGARQPAPEWGAMLATSREYALSSWWYVVFPSIALFMTVTGFLLLGSAFEERLSGRHSLSRRTIRALTPVPPEMAAVLAGSLGPEEGAGQP
jgi:peptide/nickel transport system permease protein